VVLEINKNNEKTEIQNSTNAILNLSQI